MDYIAEYPLKPNGVKNSLTFVEETLKKIRVKQRDLLEALLISEETLLFLTKKAPEDANIKVIVSRRMGVPRIQLRVPGSPMALDEHLETISVDRLGGETEEAIRSIMLRSYADSIKYRHRHSENTITIISGIPERILANNTLAAIGLAVLTALMLRPIISDASLGWMVTNIIAPVESLFISALMCITAPAVFVSVTCSMFRFEGFADLGRSSKKIVATYLMTSLAAILLGVYIFNLFSPGDFGIVKLSNAADTKEVFSFLTILSSLIPPNIVEPFSSVNSLQLMAVAITIGTALTMCGKRVKHLRTLLEEMDVLCEKVSSLVMNVVPLVVYCSIMNVMLNTDTVLLLSGVKLIPAIAAGLGSLMVMYVMILIFGAHLNPIPFLKKYVPTMKSVFLKGSSIAAIPVNMRISRRQLGVPHSISSFSIPLGATINMDGNCLCLTIISLFYARICGFSLGTNETIVLLLIVLVLSLGAPIAPGTLILCLVTLMTQMGIEISLISPIICVNFILEMMLGMVNCVGDVVVSLVVAKKEGVLDLGTYLKK